jgi:hypothetical protein
MILYRDVAGARFIWALYGYNRVERDRPQAR